MRNPLLNIFPAVGLLFASIFSKTDMPEGPSLVILKEAVAHFEGKKILAVAGNSSIEKQKLVNKKITGFHTWGKHFIIEAGKIKLRIHFLLFGSYSIDENIKPAKSLRLSLTFKNGTIYFYTCAIKELDGDLDDLYDWTADVMNDDWSTSSARKKLKLKPDMLACDALLNQDIFAGVGNIIKNEVLYRIKVHPSSLIGSIPPRLITKMINEARNYSFDFLKWKKEFVLKKHWLIHTKKVCKRCDLPVIKEYCGTTNRRTFFCTNCQQLYI